MYLLKCKDETLENFIFYKNEDKNQLRESKDQEVIEVVNLKHQLMILVLKMEWSMK